MSTTHRSDGPMLAGYHHSGDRGLGLLAETFPGSGTHGPSLPFPGLVFPADTGKEIIARVVTVPPLLTVFTVDELGRVQAEGPVGSHAGTAEGFANGVSYGLYPFYVQIGVGNLTGGVTTDDAAASGSAGTAASQLSGSIAADDAVPTGGFSIAAPAQASGSIVADDATASGSVAVASPAIAGGSTLADDASPSGTVVGYVEPVAVIGSRVVIAGRRRTPVHLAGLDVAEVDDIAFRFATVLLPGEAVLSYACAAEPRVGTDARPAPLRVGAAQKFGPDCIQRVDGSLAEPGVTYLLRCEALLNSGRTAVAQAFLRVVSFAA